MKVSNVLKQEIIKYFDKLKHKSNTNPDKRYIEKQLTTCERYLLDNGYLKQEDLNGITLIKPTEKLLFLPFGEIKNLINNFVCIEDDYEKDFKERFNFFYEKLRDKFGEKLQKENEIYICPYCEKNYINLVETENKTIKPDLDHFYPKSKYPFLACCIENLIPACQVCNSRLKGDKEISINPFENRVFEDFEFSYNGNQIYLKNYLELQEKEEVKNYLETFKIQEVYSTHTEILEDIQIKFKKYNDIKRKHLVECCPSMRENEILEVIFYEYKYENKKHPLRKLKKDLFEQIRKEATS
jgi:hypothetical protein